VNIDDFFPTKEKMRKIPLVLLVFRNIGHLRGFLLGSDSIRIHVIIKKDKFQSLGKTSGEHRKSQTVRF
jgi:hypothetical protein